jgi:hypothetical protein
MDESNKVVGKRVGFPIEEEIKNIILLFENSILFSFFWSEDEEFFYFL